MTDGHSTEIVRFDPHTNKHKMLNHNSYATKKTVAQGMLDIALLTANASQLKYLLQVGTTHDFYYLMVSMISISIILQIAIGVLACVLTCLDITVDKYQKAAEAINQTVVILGFALTGLNTFISPFIRQPKFNFRYKYRNETNEL